jgi:hypothetical protein
MSLSDAQVERYSRQIILAEIGGRGQEILLHSAVRLSDGSEPMAGAARYLAAAGIGRIATAGDTTLARELARLNPTAQIDVDGTSSDADVVLAGAAPLPEMGSILLIRAGVNRSRAWVAVGETTAPLCRHCDASPPAAGDAYTSVAYGLAAAQMALAALAHLVGMAGATLRPAVTVFDAANGTWRNGDAGVCASCGRLRN